MSHSLQTGMSTGASPMGRAQIWHFICQHPTNHRWTSALLQAHLWVTRSVSSQSMTQIRVIIVRLNNHCKATHSTRAQRARMAPTVRLLLPVAQIVCCSTLCTVTAGERSERIANQFLPVGMREIRRSSTIGWITTCVYAPKCARLEHSLARSTIRKSDDVHQSWCRYPLQAIGTARVRCAGTRQGPCTRCEPLYSSFQRTLCRPLPPFHKCSTRLLSS